MSHRIHNILNAFNQGTLFTESPSKIEPFHIYFKLKDFYKDKLTPTESIKMYSHHLKLEKGLSLLRQRNLAGAEAILGEIKRLDRNFPEFVQDAMDSLYYAMMSYYDYISYNNHEEALLKLRASIEKGTLQSKTYPFFCISIPTQWINILRVLIRTKQEPEIIIETTNLVKLTLLGVHENKTLVEAYHSLGKEEKDLVIRDVFDNLVFNLQRSFSVEKSNEIFFKIVSNILAFEPITQSFNSSVVWVLSILKDFENENYDSFLNKLNQPDRILLDIPTTLKQMIIDRVEQLEPYEAAALPLNQTITFKQAS